MVLEQLLRPVPASAFLEPHCRKRPFARPGGCARLAALGSWETLARILPQPGVGLLAGREGQPYAGRPPATAEEARALLAEGYTLGIRHAEKHDGGLAG